MMYNKNKLLMLVTFIFLLLVVIGSTFAYFIAQYGGTTLTDIDVKANTTDNLIFTTGDEIIIDADQNNFASGKGNITGSTNATASLIANDAGIEASFNYYVYLNIKTNEFVYTTENEEAELILTITGPNGEVKELEGLTYNSDLGGFDITTQKGLITIANNYEIKATNTTSVHDWTITITLVNLNSDQELNTGKNFKANVLIRKEMYEVLSFADYIKKLYTVDGDKGLYLHDSDLAYGAHDGNYRYSGSNKEVDNYVCFGSYAKKCPDEYLYRIIGVYGDKVKLIKSDAISSEMLGMNSSYTYAIEDFYGFYKGNLETLPGFYWSGSASNYLNSWPSSLLNTDALNKTYLTNLGEYWENMISEEDWQVGGNTEVNILLTDPYNVYISEIIAPAQDVKYTGKVGLMYTYEYYYAASPNYWVLPGYDEGGDYDENGNWIGNDYTRAINDNWLHMGFDEWTITRVSDSTDNAFVVFSDGGVVYRDVFYDLIVRPTFSLKNLVKYDGGKGTLDSPYRIYLS